MFTVVEVGVRHARKEGIATSVVFFGVRHTRRYRNFSCIFWCQTCKEGIATSVEFFGGGENRDAYSCQC